MAGDFRRKWDKDEFQKIAYERLLAEKEEDDDDKPKIAFRRDLLRPRDYKIDIDSKVGKSIVVTKTTPVANLGGYYCNVCDCIVKDSINFLDHVNGRKHIKNLGMSMKIERSTVDQVKERILMHKQKEEEAKKEYNFEHRIKELKSEEEKQKMRKREKLKAKKLKKNDGEARDLNSGNAESEIAAIMGFGSFSAKK